MIKANELRLGNYILQKTGVRILPVRCSAEHIAQLAAGEAKTIFPVVLKPELLLKCGFVENKNYPLLPSAREFSLTLPLPGTVQTALKAWSKSNGECFARAVIDQHSISRNVYHLHQLQNLYYWLTGQEMEVKL